MRSPSATAQEIASRASRGQVVSARRLGATIIAWSLGALSLTLLIGALALVILSAVALAHGGPLLPAYMYVTNAANPLDLIGDALNLVAMLAFALFGVLITRRYPAHPVGWIFAALSLFGIGEEFATSYAIYGLIARPGALPYSLVAAWVTEWTWTVFFGLLNVFLPLLFPTGHLLSARWRPIGWFAGAACAVLTVGFMLKPGPFGNRTRLESFESPVTLFARDSRIASIGTVSFACVLVSMLLAAVSLIVRLRRARGDERQQLKWFCYPAALLVGWFVLQGVLRYGLGVASPQGEIALKLGWAVSFTALPIATGIAILKYRLYEINVVINRTLVYGALSAAISGIYVLVVGALGALFQAQGNLLIALLGAGLVAVLFGPLRERLQRGVNRLMYGERDEPYAVLSRLGRRLETTLAPHAVLPTIVETVQDALKLPYVAIALASAGPQADQIAGDGFEVAAAAG
jgi:two-component system, NarL family, sensor kinase